MKLIFKAVIGAVATILIASSCAAPLNYYQLGTVSPADNSVKSTNDYLTYSDDNIAVMYDFWSTNGKVSCIIHNLSDKDITIHLDKSFLIKNGYAFDYFTNSVYTHNETNTYSKSSGVALSGVNVYGKINAASALGVASSKTNTYTNSDTQHSVETVSITVPAHTRKVIQKFNYLIGMFRDCDMFLFNFKKQTDMEFSMETTPLIFENRFVYTVDGDEERRNVNNKFYISKVSNHKESEFKREKVSSLCDDEKMTSSSTVHISKQRPINAGTYYEYDESETTSKRKKEATEIVVTGGKNQYYIRYTLKDFDSNIKH